MCYLKLFPHNHSPSANFACVNLESTSFIAEHVRVFRQNSRKKSYNSPGKKTSICCCVAAVEETVLFLRVPVQIAINVDFLAFVFLVELLGEENLRMKLFVRIEPLSVKVVT